jgi:hypothetical protein
MEFTVQVDQIRENSRARDDGGPKRQYVEKSHFQPPRVGFHFQPGDLDTGNSVTDPRNALTVNGVDLAGAWPMQLCVLPPQRGVLI